MQCILAYMIFNILGLKRVYSMLELAGIEPPQNFSLHKV